VTIVGPSNRPGAVATDKREPASEQSRARYPDTADWVEVDGIRTYYEVYGSGEPTILFLPTWTLVHSRIWKMQIPVFARHHRVITFDPRGNGRSDRPTDPAAYDERAFAADALAVLDATGTDRAVVVTLSMGAVRGMYLAVEHPERVTGLAFIAPATSLGRGLPERSVHPFSDRLDTTDGWAKYNEHHWRNDYADFLEFFLAKCFSEPHSTKGIEDGVNWALETDPETLIAAQFGRWPGADETADLAGRLRCPTLVIQGTDDAITGTDRARALAEAAGGPIAWIGGGGHVPNARDPVRINLLLRDFVGRVSGAAATAPPTTRWARAMRRRRRILYISSPIGLGHAQRDAAIAAELRLLHPDVEIDWLAQHPVTVVLDERGERLHPASRELASESAHIAAESKGHSLNAFQAVRRMDEIMVSNFMVFHDAVCDGEYDLVIGDEAWEVDYYLHENPEIKRTAYAWLTDFVGWLPMPAGGEREAFVTADYNAEMIEHIARHPRVRDRAIFVGEPDDIVPDAFGPSLPYIRDWTERHYAFAGYVTGFDPRPLIEQRDAIRRELGYRPDEKVVVVTVGGSGVGEALLRRIVAGYPEARLREPALRMVAVAGPRISPEAVGAPDGVEVRAFVPDLYRHLAACDLAIVQGGLTTTMELVAARRPFIYFPLADHFEQNRHVAHRLDRYRAGRRMSFADADPDAMATAIVEELGRPIDYLPVAPDGAARAAALIAELL
jgi:pimeloyl-ACP methyl ester carboxylesterase/predicted glycosyltransferase